MTLDRFLPFCLLVVIYSASVTTASAASNGQKLQRVPSLGVRSPTPSFSSMSSSSLSVGMPGMGTSTGTISGSPSAKGVRLHKDPFNAAFEQASAAQRAKEFDRALDLFRHAARMADLRSRPMSWMTAQFNICHTLNLQGKKEEAAALARQIVADCESSVGSGDPLTSEALAHLAFVLKQHGRLADAEPVYRRNVRVLETKYGTDHYLVANAICRHGSLLQSLGRLSEAEKQLRRALTITLSATDGSGDPTDTCFFLTHLAFCLHATHQAAEARELMDLAYEIVQQEDDSSLVFANSILRRQAEYFRDIKELDRAEALARRCLLRLARRHDVNRVKFFYYDTVAELYRTVLRAKGIKSNAIEAAIQQVQSEGAMAQATANTATSAVSPAVPAP